MNTDVFNDVATEEEIQEDFSEADSSCSVPIVHLNPDVLETESMNLLAERAYVDALLTVLPVCWLSQFVFISLTVSSCLFGPSFDLFSFQVLSEEEQNVIAATPAHPAGLYGKSSLLCSMKSSKRAHMEPYFFCLIFKRRNLFLRFGVSTSKVSHMIMGFMVHYFIVLGRKLVNDSTLNLIQ